MTAAADRHLLFGLLALAERDHQPGPARGRLPGLDARQVQEPGRPPGSPRRPDRRQRALLEALAAVHLEAHGGDVEKSLAAVSAGKSTRESLARIGDPEIEATLGHVASAHGSTEDGDGDRTDVLRRRLGHQRRPAVPRAPAACPGRAGGRVRGPRRRAESRGGAQADPRPPRRRPGQPPAVLDRGRDHRRTGTPRDRAGLRAGHVRRRPPLLRDAVHQGRQPQGGDRTASTPTSP